MSRYGDGWKAGVGSRIPEGSDEPYMEGYQDGLRYRLESISEQLEKRGIAAGNDTVRDVAASVEFPVHTIGWIQRASRSGEEEAEAKMMEIRASYADQFKHIKPENRPTEVTRVVLADPSIIIGARPSSVHAASDRLIHVIDKRDQLNEPTPVGCDGRWVRRPDLDTDTHDVFVLTHSANDENGIMYCPYHSKLEEKTQW